MSYFKDVFNALIGRGRQMTPGGSSVALHSWMNLGENNIQDAFPRLSTSEMLSCPAAVACIDVISEGIAMLPLRTYRVRNGVAEEATDAVGRRINHMWSPKWTRMTGLRYVTQQALIHGSGFVHITRDLSGVVTALTPIRSSCINVIQQDGVLSYEFVEAPGGRRAQLFPAEDVIDIVFKYRDDGFERLAKLEEAREPITRYLLQSRNARRFFSTGAPAHTIAFPPWAQGDAISDKAQMVMRKNIIDMVRQANEVGSPFLPLEHGMTVQKIGVDPDKSQFTESQLAMTQEIARVFSVPSAAIGDLTKATFANAELSANQLVRHTLMPLLVTIEQEMNAKLFGRQQGMPNYVRFDWSEFTRSDMKGRADVASKLVTAGVYSQNDARRLMDLPPKEGAEYDELHQQAQMEPASEETSDGGNDPTGGGDDGGNENE